MPTFDNELIRWDPINTLQAAHMLAMRVLPLLKTDVAPRAAKTLRSLLPFLQSSASMQQKRFEQYFELLQEVALFYQNLNDPWIMDIFLFILDMMDAVSDQSTVIQYSTCQQTTDCYISTKRIGEDSIPVSN